MKPMQLKVIVGTAIVVFLLTTSAWADGRNRGGGGHSYSHGYQKKHSHGHYKHKRHGLRNHYKHHYRHHHRYDHHYRHRPHHRHHKPRDYRSSSYRTGVYFSFNQPYVSFGFSTGKH